MTARARALLSSRPHTAHSADLLSELLDHLDGLTIPGTLALAVSGSVARGEACPASDVDLIRIAAASEERETIITVGGLRCSIVTWGTGFPLDVLRGASCTLWAMREIARVRAAIPLYDPGGRFAGLQQSLASIRLPRQYERDCIRTAERRRLRGMELAHDRPEAALLALSAALVLAITPALHAPELLPHRYYSKPKFERRCVAALPIAGIADLYDLVHGTLDRADLERQRAHLAALRAVACSGRGDAAAEVVAGRVAGFITDASSLSEPADAAVPLRYAAYELAWLVTEGLGREYRWVVDALPALTHAGLVDTFFAAAGLRIGDETARLQAAASGIGALISHELRRLDR